MVPGSNPGRDTISARVTLDMLLTHIVSLPRFDGHSSTYGTLTKVFNFLFFTNVKIDQSIWAVQVSKDKVGKKVTKGKGKRKGKV